MHIQVKRLSGVIGSPTIVFSPESLSFDSEGIGRGQKSAFVLPFQLPRVSGTSHARFQVMLDMGSSLRHEWIPISDPFTVKCTASEPQPLPSIQAESQVMLQEEEVNDPISIAADSTSEYQQVANGLDQCQIAISLISNEGQSGSSSIIESSSIDSAGPSQYSSGSSGAPLSRLIECKKPVSSQSNISTLSEPQVAQMGDFQVEAEYTPNSLQTTSESSVLFLTGEQNSMVSSEVMEHQQEFPLADSLQKLTEMGFTDSEHNTSLLLQYKDYHRVMQHLLQESLDQWTVLEPTNHSDESADD
eukprot:TRINITY_DN2493_c0_g2_i5.p1 TRINITY_DN2493_c0_g2~~TRINITY_DN2493_c0_g2_i5.p1  ORF type:complete len:302 (-),score=73.74 TRINITY_DN2493_c0_g2_i5:152-1057(-)